jgi:hypothetical protein
MGYDEKWSTITIVVCAIAHSVLVPPKVLDCCLTYALDALEGTW